MKISAGFNIYARRAGWRVALCLSSVARRQRGSEALDRAIMRSSKLIEGKAVEPPQPE
jgi:hypothetical protein